jgi:hypothetical protein
VAAVALAGVLATWLISSAKEAPDPSAAAASSIQGGPTPAGSRGRSAWPYPKSIVTLTGQKLE